MCCDEVDKIDKLFCDNNLFHVCGTTSQALASLTKLLEYNNITIVAQELLGDRKEEIHESPIKILKVGSARRLMIINLTL